MKNHLAYQPKITPFVLLLTPMQPNARIFFEHPFIYVSTRPRPSHALPSQGIKLRVNTQWDDLPRALPLVSAVCLNKHIDFKCIADSHLAEMAQSKTLPPSAAGKLITIYPRPENVREVFADLNRQLRQLSPALEPAPHPISDFPLTQNLSYRYGSFTDDTLVSPDGTRSEDSREYFQLPPWAEDPFSDILSNSTITTTDEKVTTDEEVDEEGNVKLGNGNYIVKTCLHRTFVGAVYAGVDTRNGVPICLKEARPYTKFDGVFATERLTSEFKVLSHVYHCVSKEICPKPIEVFEHHHHGHRFFVMERIRGPELLNWRHRNNNLKPSEIGKIACSLVKIIAKLQKSRVAWIDLSPSNIIIIDEAAPELRLIDAEHAIEGANSDELRFDVERLGKMLIWLANPIDTLWNNQEPIRPEDVDQYIHGMPMPTRHRRIKGFARMVLGLIAPMLLIDPLWDNEEPKNVDRYTHGMPMPPGYRRAVYAALSGEPINKISEHLSEIEQTPDNGS